MFQARGISIHPVGKAAWRIPSYHKQRVLLFGWVRWPEGQQQIVRVCCARRQWCSASAQQQHDSSSVLDDWRDRIRKGHWLDGDAGQEQAVRKLRRLQLTLERLQWDNAMVQQYQEQQQLLLLQEKETTEESMAKPMDAPVGHVVHHPRRPSLDTDSIPQNDDIDSSRTRPNDIQSSASESIVTNLQSTIPQPMAPAPSIPRGLYLYGNVGTGKSMLMDRFFALTNVSKKKRYHFHEFMSDLHRRWHLHRTRTPPVEAPAASTISTSQSAPEPEQQQLQQPLVSPIQRAARELANECSLLCLDEFQVLDVADAVLLRQVLGHLLLNGTVLVTTSNRPLSYYFEKQHRLDQHTHYIANLLQRYCVSHDMDTETDYRQLLSVNPTDSSNEESNPIHDNRNHDPAISRLPHSMYMVMNEDAPEPADAATRMRQRIEQVLQCVLGDDYETTVTPLPLGARRHVEIVCCTTSDTSTPQRVVIGEVSFDDLCVHHHLVAADYRLMAERVHGLCVTDLPSSIQDSLRGHDVARRWVHCIDSLYEARIPLLCTNTTPQRTPLSQLFVSTRTKMSKHPYSSTTASGDDSDNDDNDNDELLWADQATSMDGYARGALVSVEDLPVAMRRAASRLVEMTSRQWWGKLAPNHDGNGHL